MGRIVAVSANCGAMGERIRLGARSARQTVACTKSCVALLQSAVAAADSLGPGGIDESSSISYIDCHVWESGLVVVMTGTLNKTTNGDAVKSSTLRVRRFRERRRGGLHRFTVTVPETVIEPALIRGLLAEEDRLQPWRVIESCYAAQLSDAALERLIREGVITRQQRAEAATILRGISRWLEHANG